jgi:hypothetical protein
MPGFTLTAAATITCIHGATVKGVPSNVRVKLGGSPVLTASDVFSVVGCPFTLPSGTPHPCITVEWKQPGTKLLPAKGPLTSESVGICKAADGAPQGKAIVVPAQNNTRSR